MHDDDRNRTSELSDEWMKAFGLGVDVGLRSCVAAIVECIWVSDQTKAGSVFRRGVLDGLLEVHKAHDVGYSNDADRIRAGGRNFKAEVDGLAKDMMKHALEEWNNAAGMFAELRADQEVAADGEQLDCLRAERDALSERIAAAEARVASGAPLPFPSKRFRDQLREKKEG